jgi:hypothetical protein
MTKTSQCDKQQAIAAALAQRQHKHKAAAIIAHSSNMTCIVKPPIADRNKTPGQQATSASSSLAAAAVQHSPLEHDLHCEASLQHLCVGVAQVLLGCGVITQLKALHEQLQQLAGTTGSSN